MKWIGFLYYINKLRYIKISMIVYIVLRLSFLSFSGEWRLQRFVKYKNGGRNDSIDTQYEGKPEILFLIYRKVLEYHEKILISKYS